jgi:hypothetical protein
MNNATTKKGNAMTTQRNAPSNAPTGQLKTIVDAIATTRNVTLYRKGQ